MSISPQLQTLLRSGIAAAKSGDRKSATSLLAEALKIDANNEAAWLWMAWIAETPREAERCILRLLEISPSNPHALEALRKIRQRLGATGPAWRCPLCEGTSQSVPDRCPRCRSVVALDRLDALFDTSEVDQEMVAKAIERLELLLEEVGGDFVVYVKLGLGCLNARRYADGIAHLRAASRTRPDDEGFRSQVETLSARAMAAAFGRSAEPEKKQETTILVIDDSLTVRKVVGSALQRGGYQVVVAADGVEALSQIEKIVPDLILLDISMPFMDGYQVCAALKENGPTRNVPVVMLSGHDGFLDKIRGRRAGAAAHISKMADQTTILQTIGKFVKPGPKT